MPNLEMSVDKIQFTNATAEMVGQSAAEDVRLIDRPGERLVSDGPIEISKQSGSTEPVQLEFDIPVSLAEASSQATNIVQ